MKHIGVLMGGLDSAVLASRFAQQGFRVHPIYIREGLRWESAELAHLKAFLRRRPFPSRWTRLVTLELPAAPLYENHWSLKPKAPVPGARTADAAVFLPGRNLGLTITAGLYCILHGIPRLALALLNHNPFRDSKKPFFLSVERTIAAGTGKRLSILTPFARLPKSEIIRKGKAWPIHLTLSCLNPKGEKHCGACNKCAERKKGFKVAEIPDLSRYSR